MRWLLFILFLQSYNCIAQKYDYIWCLGQGGNGNPASVIDFNYGFDSIYAKNRLVYISGVNSSICDTSGNFLFYTNGISIIDSSEQIMLNGDSINPGIIAQIYEPTGYPTPDGAITIPNPNNDSIFKLFHLGLEIGGATGVCANQLYVTTINSHGNGNKGVVLNKNYIIVEDTFHYGHLEAVKHGNGLDWWILVPQANNNGYYRFLLTEDSLFGPYYQQIGQTQSILGNGQAVFSPNGTKYARYDHENDLSIFDFDRCTGLLSNDLHISITNTVGIVGAAFSASSQYLYLASMDTIYQFDVTASNILASKNIVAIYDGYQVLGLETSFFYAQLAPNNKIYISTVVDVLHVIHSPDSAGLACNVEQHGIHLPAANHRGLPNFPHYRTPALAGSPCDTLTSTIIIDIGEQQQGWEVILYPNPTDKELTIESNTVLTTTTNITIYNTLGQLIQTVIIDAETNTTSIKTDNLLNGVYVLQVQEGSRKVAKVFVVSKK